MFRKQLKGLFRDSGEQEPAYRLLSSTVLCQPVLGRRKSVMKPTAQFISKREDQSQGTLILFLSFRGDKMKTTTCSEPADSFTDKT
jgi:hypothetical protein